MPRSAWRRATFDARAAALDAGPSVSVYVMETNASATSVSACSSVGLAPIDSGADVTPAVAILIVYGVSAFIRADCSSASANRASSAAPAVRAAISVRGHRRVQIERLLTGTDAQRVGQPRGSGIDVDCMPSHSTTGGVTSARTPAAAAGECVRPASFDGEPGCFRECGHEGRVNPVHDARGAFLERRLGRADEAGCQGGRGIGGNRAPLPRERDELQRRLDDREARTTIAVLPRTGKGPRQRARACIQRRIAGAETLEGEHERRGARQAAQRVADLDGGLGGGAGNTRCAKSSSRSRSRADPRRARRCVTPARRRPLPATCRAARPRRSPRRRRPTASSMRVRSAGRCRRRGSPRRAARHRPRCG